MPECSSGKRRWVSRGQAVRGAKAVSRDAKRNFRAYLCPECKGFHITGNDFVKWVPATKPHRYTDMRGSEPEPGESVEELAARLRERRR